MDYKYTGIILDKKDVGETDRIYTIYTLENGKIRVLAKSVRKANAKLAGFLENFTLAEIFIAKNQGMGKITGAIVLNSFSKIKENLESLQNVFASLKIFGKLVGEESGDENVFHLLKGYLETIEKINDNHQSELVSLGFSFKIFEELGYKIEAGSCMECQERIREGENFFDSERGGIVCGKCSSKSGNKIRVNNNAIKILRIFFQNSVKSLAKLRAEKKDLNNLEIIKKEFLSWIA